MSTDARGPRHVLPHWEVEDESFWKRTGARVARRNLWISIPNLLCGFAVWMSWGMVATFIQRAHFADPDWFAFRSAADGSLLGGDAYRALLFTLPAVAGLTGATLRIPNSFMVALCGGRNVILFTTLLLLLPAVGTGLALQRPETPFGVFVTLAALSGAGGGAFASSMSNISFFFPRRSQGLSLGLNAGLGNLGVSLMQFLLPWVVGFAAFGALAGGPCLVAGQPVWLQNAGFVWVPALALCAAAAALGMNTMPAHGGLGIARSLGRYLWLTVIGLAAGGLAVALLRLRWPGVPEAAKIAAILVIAVTVTLAGMRRLTPRATRAGLDAQFAIFRNRHTWVMTWLYTMTFGSFIGYANAFPKLIDDVFGVIRVDAGGAVLAQGILNPNAPDTARYVWIGAGVGALIRPLGGWLSDRIGGARVTHWDTLLMVGATIVSGWIVAQASRSPQPEQYFPAFLGLFVLLFATTGVGNGSTFRMIPIIFQRDQAGPVLGWTSAIGAYGAFLIPTIFASQIAAGTPQHALYGFAAYYLSCLAVNWWFYARKGAEIPC